MNNDIALFYYGGCGGQLVFHLLNTLDEFSAIFVKNKQIYNFKSVLQNQWQDINTNEWKDSEIWPDNRLTKKYISKNRLYLFCNEKEDFTKCNAKIKIVLYANYFTHVNLAFYKKAHWFCKNTVNLQYFLDSYNNIKDSTWPTIENLEDFKFLKKEIQQELIEVFNFIPEIFSEGAFDLEKIRLIKLYDMKQNASTEKYKNTDILSNYINEGIIDNAAIVVALEDIIETNGKILFSQLNITYDKSLCDNIIKDWLKLHPTELLRNLNWKP